MKNDLKVFLEMDEHLPAALQQTPSGGRLDLSLYFRRKPDGSRWGGIVIRGVGGRPLAELPIDSPEGMNMALARLVYVGFRAATARRSSSASAGGAGAPAQAAPSPATLVAGVDGYRRGWVVAFLDPTGAVTVSTCRTFSEVVVCEAGVIAVDIPIGIPDGAARPADAAARRFVGRRASSVFTTPPRGALEAEDFAQALVRARGATGKGVSKQAFELRGRILEVDGFAHGDGRIIEVHPEVCFRELAGRAIEHSKHTAQGLEERRMLLQGAGLEIPAAPAGVPEADLLDALVAAWTAARYQRGVSEPLPEGHHERIGAIWR